jgi:Spy/CpxP family protein refolding chaperone
MIPRPLVRSLAALCAAVLVLTSVASAQPFKWWQSEKFIKELGLTSEQIRTLENTFQASLPNLRALKKALDEAEAEFERRWERGDEAPIMEQVNRVEAARAELNKARTTQLLRMRKVLTTNQWAKFTALHQAAERERLANQQPHADGK